MQYHWLWSVIGHPTIQAAVTEPGDQINIKWNSIFGFGPLDNAIQYENRPLYSGAIMLLNVRDILFSDLLKMKLYYNLINRYNSRPTVR